MDYLDVWLLAFWCPQPFLTIPNLRPWFKHHFLEKTFQTMRSKMIWNRISVLICLLWFSRDACKSFHQYPSLNTQSCIRRPLCSALKFENLSISRQIHQLILKHFNQNSSWKFLPLGKVDKFQGRRCHQNSSKIRWQRNSSRTWIEY